jgi:DUF4097 and DUF4098 domain-containing protein YvlB
MTAVQRHADFRFVSPARALAAAAALVTAAPTANAGPISERAAADPAGRVEIANTAGSVTVAAWARSEVEVTGELGEGSERLEFVTQGKLTRIRVVLPKRSYGVDETRLVVKVPAASGLSVNTISADIAVEGVRGGQRLQSVSGNVRTATAAQDVEIKSVSGDVEVTGSGARGLVTLTTVSGDATLANLAGEVNANTVSGNLAITMTDVARSRVRSTSGDLGFRGRLAPDARLDLESISGDIRLDIEGPVGADFDLSTFNGDIRNCFGPKPVRTDEYAPGSELRFQEGSGSGQVRIKTLNGDISVCNK